MSESHPNHDELEARGVALIAAAENAIAKARVDENSQVVTLLSSVYRRSAIYLRRYADYLEAEAALQDAQGALAISRGQYRSTDAAKTRLLADQGVMIIPLEAFCSLRDPEDVRSVVDLLDSLADACH